MIEIDSNNFFMYYCSFTGHRIIPKRDICTLRKCLHIKLYALAKLGARHFYAGGALGFDYIVAQEVLNMKNEYPDFKLSLIIPSLDYRKNWSRKQVLDYNDIIGAADSVEYISEKYQRGNNLRRNRILVDKGDALIAYCNINKEKSGSMYTVNYAKEKNKPVINLYNCLY